MGRYDALLKGSKKPNQDVDTNKSKVQEVTTPEEVSPTPPPVKKDDDDVDKPTPHGATYVDSYARTFVRSDVAQTARRSITRYAFEIYQDQIDTLRQLSIEQKLQGEKGSMSEMVRSALDDYLKRMKVKKART